METPIEGGSSPLEAGARAGVSAGHVGPADLGRGPLEGVGAAARSGRSPLDFRLYEWQPRDKARAEQDASVG